MSMDIKKKIKLPPDFWVVATWVLLLIPALIFWTSVVMYAGLGTDYVYDVIVEKLSQTTLGNTVLVLFVMGFPVIVIVISGLEYFKTKNIKMKWGMGLGSVFLVLGLLTLLIKS
jgi:hypothetical protein